MALDQLDVPRQGSNHPGARRQRRTRRSARRAVVTTTVCAAVLVLVLVTALELHGGVRQAVDRVADDPSVAPSSTAMLSDLWSSYKQEFLEEGTSRTVDTSLGGITTSEGQSYTMMRSVWMDDRTTFDASWQWTKDNLQRPDHLVSWKFGVRSDGSYGVQTDSGGQNAASDADVDIAFSLLMAYSRWADDDYLYDALPLIDAVWALEVVDVAGAPVLAANDLERANATSVIVNPSYFAPYAYRAFAHVDPGHDWARLVDSSYRVLAQVSTDPLGGDSAPGLVPDWVRLDRATGAAAPALDVETTQGDPSVYGYEALRLPWRLGLDWRWNGDERARVLLERHAAVLGGALERSGALAAVYAHDGSPAADYSSLAMYGGAMAALDVASPELGRQVYRTELLPQYDADVRKASSELGYYDANWMWFGMALHLDRLPDLNDASGSDLP